MSHIANPTPSSHHFARPTSRAKPVLTKTLPRVTAIEVEGVGHMAPLTHPERVNALIEGFLDTEAYAPR